MRLERITILTRDERILSLTYGRLGNTNEGSYTDTVKEVSVRVTGR
jgi:hypothetical protein